MATLMIPSALKKRRGCSSGVCTGLIAAITRPQWRALHDTGRRGRQTSCRADDSRLAATVGLSAPALASSRRSSGERSARDVVVAHLYGDTFPGEALREFCG